MSEDGQRLYSELKSSGKTVAEFSRERGIPVSRMYELSRRKGSKKGAVGNFVRVGKAPLITVIVSEAVRLEVPLESLREVLVAIGVSR